MIGSIIKIRENVTIDQNFTLIIGRENSVRGGHPGDWPSWPARQHLGPGRPL